MVNHEKTRKINGFSRGFHGESIFFLKKYYQIRFLWAIDYGKNKHSLNFLKIFDHLVTQELLGATIKGRPKRQIVVAHTKESREELDDCAFGKFLFDYKRN